MARVESMQASSLFHQPLTGLQVQVVGVGEDDLCTGIVNLRRGHRLESSVSTDRHENRCLYNTMRCCHTASAGAAFLVSGKQFKLQHNDVTFICRRRSAYGVYLLMMWRTLTELISYDNNQK